MSPEPTQKVIALGVTGSIAAYKAADLVSRLVRNGHEVHVLMTAAARELVTERTFLTLSRNPVVVSLWDMPEWQPGHVELADRADLLVVAPATANFLGKYTHGIADDALTTYALAHEGPVLLAPAMNPRMWRHPATQANRVLLRKRGVRFVGPGSGHVACGDDGEGRMAEPADILVAIQDILGIKSPTPARPPVRRK
jgi:phosphopantothenoylcysteine synthetase/decarboxylase